LFAGTMVPLWFYPDGLRTLANVLPFQFLAFFPAATWMGELSGPEIARSPLASAGRLPCLGSAGGCGRASSAASWSREAEG
ncbi:MAG: hypothetical protein M3490_12680, partial [Chloroflexota bacterium]|nr:hypothetical protein [Chloroflexota bacterium]